MSAHGAALHECADDDDDRAGNVALAGFPASDSASALDLDEVCKTPGAEAEGVAGGFEFVGGHARSISHSVHHLKPKEQSFSRYCGSQ